MNVRLLGFSNQRIRVLFYQQTNRIMEQEQTTLLKEIVPDEFRSLFPIDPKFYEKTCITAGVFGFERNKSEGVRRELYNASRAGLCLGFSVTELWKNKGKNK